MTDNVQTTTANLDFAAKEAAPFQPLVQLAESAGSDSAEQPDYLPARMLNEFVYCPRLFYYEWVEGVFVNSVDTVAGSLRHQKLERKEDALPAAEELIGTQDKIHSRSVQLASDTHRLIAKLDLIEGEGDLVVPVDYKIGKPRLVARRSASRFSTRSVEPQSVEPQSSITEWSGVRSSSRSTFSIPGKFSKYSRAELPSMPSSCGNAVARSASSWYSFNKASA